MPLRAVKQSYSDCIRRKKRMQLELMQNEVQIDNFEQQMIDIGERKYNEANTFAIKCSYFVALHYVLRDD